VFYKWFGFMSHHSFVVGVLFAVFLLTLLEPTPTNITGFLVGLILLVLYCSPGTVLPRWNIPERPPVPKKILDEFDTKLVHKKAILSQLKNDDFSQLTMCSAYSTSASAHNIVHGELDLNSSSLQKREYQALKRFAKTQKRARDVTLLRLEIETLFKEDGLTLMSGIQGSLRMNDNGLVSNACTQLQNIFGSYGIFCKDEDAELFVKMVEAAWEEGGRSFEAFFVYSCDACEDLQHYHVILFVQCVFDRNRKLSKISTLRYFIQQGRFDLEQDKFLFHK